MNIEFEYIEIQNFKSIGPMQIFNFKELDHMNYIYRNKLRLSTKQKSVVVKVRTR